MKLLARSPVWAAVSQAPVLQPAALGVRRPASVRGRRFFVHSVAPRSPPLAPVQARARPAASWEARSAGRQARSTAPLVRCAVAELDLPPPTVATADWPTPMHRRESGTDCPVNSSTQPNSSPQCPPIRRAAARLASCRHAAKRAPARSSWVSAQRPRLPRRLPWRQFDRGSFLDTGRRLFPRGRRHGGFDQSGRPDGRAPGRQQRFGGSSRGARKQPRRATRSHRFARAQRVIAYARCEDDKHQNTSAHAEGFAIHALPCSGQRQTAILPLDRVVLTISNRPTALSPESKSRTIVRRQTI